MNGREERKPYAGFQSREDARSEREHVFALFTFRPNILKFSETAGRKRFVTAVGEFLNEMRAAEENKTAWKKAVESFE